jgi:hypothetical protein
MLFPQPGHAVQYECRIKVTRRKLGYVLVLSNGTNTSVRVVSMGKLSLASPVRSRCIGDVNQDRDSAATRRQHTSNHHPLTSLGGGGGNKRNGRTALVFSDRRTPYSTVGPYSRTRNHSPKTG